MAAMSARILVADDDPKQAELIRLYLERDGHSVLTVPNGRLALEQCRSRRPDLLVLDVMMPLVDGLDVCRIIRAESTVAILLVTARSTEDDLLLGLDLGADDYMTKPFSMRELVARTKVLLRRTERAARAAELASVQLPDPPLVVGDVTIDTAQRRVQRAGTEVHLTPTEFELLLTLASSPRTVLTRERLLADVWDWVDASGTRRVDSHIKALRRKRGPDLIRTVHGVGYAFEPAGEPAPAEDGRS